jgi:spore coat polysaccharide biosynthesis protein SpsF
MAKPLCIIQARLTSKRLPWKVLRKVKGITLLELAYVKACAAFDRENVVVAYPDNWKNLPLKFYLWRKGMNRFGYRGKENDVLGRFHACATTYRRDPQSVIIRFTPDDHRKSIDGLRRVASGFKGDPVEIGGEAFTLKKLIYANHAVRDAFRREHITFSLGLSAPPPPPGVWTIDTLEDLKIARSYE